MTRAQELLAEIRTDLRELNIWELLQPEIRDAVQAELATAARPLPRWAAGPVVGEQTMRRLGLVRDDEPTRTAPGVIHQSPDGDVR
jgi:hypothetical protein